VAEASAVKAGFIAIGLDHQRSVVRVAEKQVSKLETRRKVRELRTFSATTRKVADYNDGEWQDLDKDDDTL
jgi:hypothetical protein